MAGPVGIDDFKARYLSCMRTSYALPSAQTDAITACLAKRALCQKNIVKLNEQKAEAERISLSIKNTKDEPTALCSSFRVGFLIGGSVGLGIIFGIK
jgi:hypothetical protein